MFIAEWGVGAVDGLSAAQKSPGAWERRLPWVTYFLPSPVQETPWNPGEPLRGTREGVHALARWPGQGKKKQRCSQPSRPCQSPRSPLEHTWMEETKRMLQESKQEIKV